MSEIIEKRAINRWLCNQHFSACNLLIDQQSYELDAINFNHRGIGLFTSDRLPEVKHCLLSFQYDNRAVDIKVNKLAATIVYCHETEVGSNYGLRFDIEACSEALKGQLLDLEQALSNEQEQGDRYGLFGAEASDSCN